MRALPPSVLFLVLGALGGCDAPETCVVPRSGALGCDWKCGENGRDLDALRHPDVVGVAGSIGGSEVELALADGTHIVASIDRVVVDPATPRIHWYALSVDDEPLCAGDGLGLFVSGVWTETGAWLAARPDSPDVAATFSCSHGVIAKCVAWGYGPDVVGAEQHAACTRMARADYCGDGTAHTRDDTVIEFQDALGVHPGSRADDDFEAAWGPDGAICVNEPRYHELVDGEEQLPPCWATLPECTSLQDARSLGARLANNSAHEIRNLCSAPASKSSAK